MTVTASPPQTKPTVPFVGWSCAAENFRRYSTEHAPQGKSVLMLGVYGVGKRYMALAWQHARELDPLPIIDLDDKNTYNMTTLRRPCIAVSQRPLPKGVPFTDLSTGSLTALTQDVPGQDTIDESFAQLFPHRIYMPRLDQRKGDSICLLHFYNRFILPAVTGYTYESMSGEVWGAFVRSQWHNNARELLGSLLAAAERDGGEALPSAEQVPVNLGTLRSLTTCPDQRLPETACAGVVNFRDLPLLAAHSYYGWIREYAPFLCDDAPPRSHSVDEFCRQLVQQVEGQKADIRSDPNRAAAFVGNPDQVGRTDTAEMILRDCVSPLIDGLGVDGALAAALILSGPLPAEPKPTKSSQPKKTMTYEQTKLVFAYWAWLLIPTEDQAKSQAEWARDHDVSPQYLSKVLKIAKLRGFLPGYCLARSPVAPQQKDEWRVSTFADPRSGPGDDK